MYGSASAVTTPSTSPTHSARARSKTDVEKFPKNEVNTSSTDFRKLLRRPLSSGSSEEVSTDGERKNFVRVLSASDTEATKPINTGPSLAELRDTPGTSSSPAKLSGKMESF